MFETVSMEQDPQGRTRRTSPYGARERAWMRLGWAARPCAKRYGALRAHETDLARLGERVEALAGGDDAGLVAPHGPLSRRFVTQLRAPETSDAVAAALDWTAAAPERHLVTLTHPAYPPRLARHPDAPPVLALRGALAALDPPGIAVVGSREASPAGRANATSFAREFALTGLSILSGLAIGIDAAAHEAALAADGVTLAFMATGPDRLYPARHADLAERIVAAGGALITELPIGRRPERWCFPQRNRLMSAIARVTLVVEAAERSGTLTTARHAREQGGEVCVIPGPIHHPRSRGCHWLIRDGAELVYEPAQVLELVATGLRAELADATRAADAAARIAARQGAVDRIREAGRSMSPRGPSRGGAPPEPGSDAHRVLAALEHEDATPDRLSRVSGLAIGRVLAAASILEVRGLARRDGAGAYARCDPV